MAIRSWIGGALLLLYFSLVYSFVMRREERELRTKHQEEFDSYAASVPLFFPRLTSQTQSTSSAPAFSWAQYKKNHEYEAIIGFFFLLMALVLIWRLRVA
jgi:uncharacterized integral membrane protein